MSWKSNPKPWRKSTHASRTQNSCEKLLIRIPELAINPLGDRIVHAFFYESKSQGEEKVDFKVSS